MKQGEMAQHFKANFTPLKAIISAIRGIKLYRCRKVQHQLQLNESASKIKNLVSNLPRQQICWLRYYQAASKTAAK